MFGLGRYSLIQKHMPQSVGIRIGAHHAGHGVGSDVSSLATIAQSPAQLVAVSGFYNTAFHLFPTATLVYVPVNIQEFHARLVSNAQVFYLARAHVCQSYIAFCSLAVDGHLSAFSYQCITIFHQHHLYIQIVQLRAAKHIDSQEQ